MSDAPTVHLIALYVQKRGRIREPRIVGAREVSTLNDGTSANIVIALKQEGRGMRKHTAALTNFNYRYGSVLVATFEDALSAPVVLYARTAK